MTTERPAPRRRSRLRDTVWVTVLICLFSTLGAVSARADNPIVQTIYTADPAPMVYNGRLYLYTGHDEDGSSYFTMKNWHLYSTTDMVNWTDEGSPLSLNTFSWASSNAWAGQVINRNGKFYYYVPITAKNGQMSIGVAVADSPAGPFRDALGKPLVANNEIDPTVFLDDDGQAYLYWGNPNLTYVKLNPDMISYSGSPTRINLTTAGFGTRPGNVANRPTLYEEGPWVYKRNGIYYNVFAAKCCSEFIGYSTATGPTGPWTYRGTVMPTQGGSFTNHPGVIDYKGNSYFFYHNGALPGGGGYTRSVAVEKFTYGTDGSIPQMNMTTAGVPQIGTLDPFVRQEAETIAWESGVETESNGVGGTAVSFIDNGDYIKVKGAAFGNGATSFQARVASAGSGGSIEVRLGGTTGTLVGTCRVPATGGWTTWTTVSCPISGATGTKDLYLRFTGGSGSLFNFDWWQFGGGTTPTTTTTSPVVTTTTPVVTTTTTSPVVTTTTPGTTTTTPGTTTTTTGGGGKSCSAAYTVVGTWGGGFQGEVKVTAGAAAISSWKVNWSFSGGEAVTQSWGATVTSSGSTVSATNVDYNGSLGAGASTTFGFLGSSSGTPAVPSVTCTAG
jgi:arabinoxylan arabinofuranohydrolase